MTHPQAHLQKGINPAGTGKDPTTCIRAYRTLYFALVPSNTMRGTISMNLKKRQRASKEGTGNATRGRSRCVGKRHDPKERRSSCRCIGTPKATLLRSPSASDTPDEVKRKALLKLAYLLKEIYEEVKVEGYRIIDGKLVKLPVDSHERGKDGTIRPPLTPSTNYEKEQRREE